MFQVLKKGARGKITCFRMSKPDDLHQHFRDKEMLQLIGPMIARRFRSAIVMPNLLPPLTTASAVSQYRERVWSATGKEFLPLMTLYLTDTLDPMEVYAALTHKIAIGIKYYPPGLTTNSESGVKNPASLWTPGTKPYECLQALAHHGGVFLIHAADGVASRPWGIGERFYRMGDELDPYDQEAHFIICTIEQIREAHPTLKISIEHLSTKWGAEYIRKNGGPHLGCSLTAHHVLLDRRDLFRKGYWVHRSWMPAIQPKEHRDELRRLATEDLPFVWLGSDSAPHPRKSKESACCTSGVLMAHAGIELYAEAFDEIGALDERFERFACTNGSAFFELEKFYSLKEDGRDTITLERKEWTVQKPFFARAVGVTETNETEVVPFRLGEKVQWQLV